MYNRPLIVTNAEGQAHSHLHISEQLEVSGPVADCNVALGHFGFGRIKCHLVSGQPALITGHHRSVDCRAGEIKVYISTCV